MTSTPSRWVRSAVVAATWIAAVVAWQLYERSEDLGTTETTQRFIDTVDGAWWGLLAFAGASLLRPLLLFPASLMTVAAGLLFGPFAGVLVVVVAANVSAMLVYGVGRALAGARTDTRLATDDERRGLITRWGDRMRTRSFETVFLMRLLFLPYDLVNYVSGSLRIRWRSFLLATVLGTLPGTVSFVLLGASLERIDQGFDGVDPLTLIAGAGIFLLSLLIARLARSRESEHTASSAPLSPDDVPGTIDTLGTAIVALAPDSTTHPHRAS